MACQKVCKVVGNICVATEGRTLMVITQVSSGLRKITIIISKLIQVSSC